MLFKVINGAFFLASFYNKNTKLMLHQIGQKDQMGQEGEMDQKGQRG